MSVARPFTSLARRKSPALFIKRATFAELKDQLAAASNIQIANHSTRQDASGLYFEERTTTAGSSFRVTRTANGVNVSPGVVCVAGSTSSYVLTGDVATGNNMFVGIRLQARPMMHSTGFGPSVVTGFNGIVELYEAPVLVAFAAHADNPLPLPDFALHTWSADPAYCVYTIPLAWVGASEIIPIITTGISIGLSAFRSGLTPGLDLELIQLR